MKAKIPIFLFCLLLLAACAPATTSDVDIQEMPQESLEQGTEELAPVPFHQEPYQVEFQAEENLSSQEQVQFKQIVEAADAPWLQIVFTDYNLGQNSFLTITSLQDGGQQKLDANSMAQWQGKSAYFNGAAVEIELHVAPGDSGIFFNIEELVVGDWVGGTPLPTTAVPDSQSELNSPSEDRSQCGTNDDRVASSDPAVGRIMPIGCTGWIVSNGAHLTAGHCIGANTQTLQFNVPDSLSDGTTVNPPPEDQYPIEAVANIDWFNDGAGAIGNDWAVFEAFANSNTGLLPVQAQNAYYRMSRDYSPATVRVTGYGVDTGTDNQTLQTHSGSFLGETVQGASDIFIEYTVDTEGGNSGSPVINTANGVTIGIHTNAGCNPPTQGNTGTSFEHDNLENAIQNFPGTNTRYADNGHPATEDGTVYRPYDTFAEAASAVPSGGRVSIVEGVYHNEAGLYTTQMLVVAPVGSVIIDHD